MSERPKVEMFTIFARQHAKVEFMDRKAYTRIIIVSLVIIAAVLWRFFNPWPNVTPIAAIALFAGAYMGRRWLAYLIPLAIMFLSDVFLGFHDTMIAVYLSFFIAVWLGFRMQNRITFTRVGLSALASSIIFFVLTNLAVWISGMVGYPKTIGGLIECYVMAIPFFRWEILSTLAFTAVIFGGFELLRKRVPALA